MRFNPFRPNSIAGPGMFAGRYSEMQQIDQAFHQLKHGNPWHFLIHGERGIGKSSLMACAAGVARGTIPIMSGNDYFHFLTVGIYLEPHTTFRGLVEKIGYGIAREIKARPTVLGSLEGAWSFLKRWEAFGVRYHESGTDVPDSDLIEELCDTVTSTAAKLRSDDGDGVVILIDEADKGAAVCQLGEFIKLFTERLTVRDCNHVAIGVSGISSVIPALKESHESSVRILNHLLLEPLLPAERLEVIKRGLDEAEEKNGMRTEIEPGAADWIAEFSEGYPHFLQQYAYSAFETDTDDKITLFDATYGAGKEHGALNQLGARYFEDMYVDQINSDDYRRVLQVMAANQSVYLARKDIKTKSGLKETTLTNALSALTSREIIIKHREKLGFYKLPNTSFAAWIRARVSQAQLRQAAKN